MPVANGVYRIQSFSPAGGSDYLTVSQTGQVLGRPLEETSDNQKWKVTERQDGYYDVVSVATVQPLRVVAPHDEETAYTVYADGTGDTEYWDLNSELRGETSLMILCTGKYSPKVLDLSAHDRVVLWDRNDHPNQNWVIQSVKPDVRVKWVTVADYSKIPANAVVGGRTTNGYPLVVARAYIPEAQGFYPGKACASMLDGCWIGYNGSERIIRSDFDVLVGDEGTFQWLPYPGGKLELGRLAGSPVEGCGDSTNGPIYSVQAPVEGEQSIGQGGAGKIFDRPQTGTGGCALLTWQGTQREYWDNYKVLCYA